MWSPPVKPNAYIFLSTNDKYDPNRLTVDVQKLRQFYLQNGYADIRVVRSSGELLADRSGFILTFQIEENQPYSVGDIEITSEIEGVDIDQLMQATTLVPGELYDVRVLEQTLSSVTNKLGEFGYAFVDVTLICNLMRLRRREHQFVGGCCPA